MEASSKFIICSAVGRDTDSNATSGYKTINGLSKCSVRGYKFTFYDRQVKKKFFVASKKGEKRKRREKKRG